MNSTTELGCEFLVFPFMMMMVIDVKPLCLQEK